MRFFPATFSGSKLVLAGLVLATVPAVASTHKHGSAKLHKTVRTAHSHETGGIPSERATEIQQALIQKGYLSGEPTGVWDSQTSAAMARLQGDNGWQTKVTPDSRALIKLGLGPTQPPADEIVASK